MPDGCQRTAPASSSTRRRRPATSGELGWRPAPWRASRRSRSGSLSARYSDTSAGRRGHSASWTRSANSTSASPQARWRKPPGCAPAALPPPTPAARGAEREAGRSAPSARSRAAIDGARARAAQSARTTPQPASHSSADGGAASVVGQPPRGDRHPPAAEPRRCRGALDQLPPAKRIRANRQHRAAAGGQGRQRGHWRAAAPVHQPGGDQPRAAASATSGGGQSSSGASRSASSRRHHSWSVGYGRSFVLPGGTFRIQLPQHHARLHRPVPLVQLELQGDIDRVGELGRPPARR